MADGSSSYRAGWSQTLKPVTQLSFASPSFWNTFWVIALIAILSGLLEPYIGYKAVGFIFMLGVLVIGAVGTFASVLFAAALSALTWNFFFIPPRLTFAIHEPADIFMVISYFIAAVVTGVLTMTVRKHEALIREREERTNVLYEVLKDISSSYGQAEFIEKVSRRLRHVLHGDCLVVLADSSGNLTLGFRAATIMTDTKLAAVARWVFDNGQMAGWSTETLPETDHLFVPLSGSSEKVGVFAYRSHSGRCLSLEQEQLLVSVCKHLALAIERQTVDQRLRETEKLKASEALHQTILNSISHEMRTPLTTIMGLASALEDEHAPDTKEFRLTMAKELSLSGERLNSVIENLLDMSRLNSGSLELKMEWHDLEDLIGVVLRRLRRQLGHHVVTVENESDLPLVEIDFRLLEHALSNLVLNAAIYSPPESVIRIKVSKTSETIRLAVEDSGPGIPPSALPHLFEKFYRVPGSKPGGTGLGLSIAKSIVDLHHGKISAENLAEGGARFSIDLSRGVPPLSPPQLTQRA